MTAVAPALCLVALGVVAALPRVFFRPGRLHARWWITAAPFFLAGTTLAGGLLGRVEPLWAPGPAWAVASSWGALAGAGAAVALIVWAVRSHARPISLWHQEDDRPEGLTTAGAYARVRHPFYAAFLLLLSACALALPHGATLLALAAARLLLGWTAAREEERLQVTFGESYRSYMRRTGRFWPVAWQAGSSTVSQSG